MVLSMHTALLIVHIILSVAIIVSVLLQSQGSGFGVGMSGGGGETYHTRRGLEKIVFYLTIATVGLFVFSSIGLLVI